MHDDDVGRNTGVGRAQNRWPLPPRETVGLAVALVVGVVYLVASLGHPLWTDDRPGAGLVPFVTALAILISAVVAMLSLRRRGAAAAADASPVVADDEDGGDREFGPASWKVPALVACLAGYVALVELAGHLATSAVLVWLALLIVGGRSWWQQILIAVLFAAGSFALFGLVLGVPLPGGVL